MSSGVQLSFTIGWIAMLLGGVLFWLSSRRLPQVEKRHGVAAMTIVFVAFANYFAMSLGQGDLFFNGRTVYFARYTDWAITTPILLASLAMFAARSLGRIATLLAALIAADVYMIVTGLVGNLSTAPYNYYWWFISMVAFLVVLALVWGPLRRHAEEEGQIAPYSKLAGMLTALWVCYPIVWLVGSSGVGMISLSVESWLYLVLDVTAKVGFGAVALNAARQSRAR
ncbi:rhodopsin [Kushneria pakistanensis]|uniref:Rhodopsin n=1 Tax=Kushneria pakistanensis TaxID=1508770 RepID=A0ABQ3FJ61_9GAMM|nr:bacteriorhodopsin [Kushneria pakistanensis]GHC25589.1 rhodopsin [Kushneria pakistanensis]